MGDRPPRQGAAGRMIATQQGGGQARGDFYDKITIERSLSAYKYEKEIGSLAVWRVSSAKPGNGVDLLVDGRDDTYWQSDGSQPHLITLQFQQKIRVSRIALQTDYRMDESYTPQRVALCIGTRWSDMKVLRTDEVHEPQGWIMIPLMKSSVTNLDVPPRECHEFVSGLVLQIGILSNHQNGRDTHVRQVKVFGPREDIAETFDSELSWTTAQAQMYATVR